MRLSSSFVFLTLLTQTFNPAFGTTDFHVKGLIELKQNKKELAFQSLEKAFDKASSDLEKASIAFLLSQAQGYSLRRNRTTYAEFALVHGTNLDAEERVRLLTIVGDGHFDLGEIGTAESAYRKALELSQSPNRSSEYATFKLGWVLLSQKKPYATYDLWLKWIHSNLDFGLRDAFLKGLGKVWVEAIVRTPKEMTARSDQGIFSLELKRDSEAIDLAHSLHQGIQRDPPSDLRHLSERIQSPGLWNKVSHMAYDTRAIFIQRPCDIMNWIESTPPHEEQLSSAYAELARCAQITKEKSKLLQIGKAYDRLKPSGTMLWPVAAIYSQAGAIGMACARQRSMINDLLAQPIPVDSSESFQQAFLSYQHECLKAKDPQVVNFGSQLAANTHFFNELALDGQRPQTPLLALLLKSLNHPDFRKGFLEGATLDPSSWTKDLSPPGVSIRIWLSELMMKNSSVDGIPFAIRISHGLPELNRHVLAAQMVRIRLASRDTERAQNDLTHYLPWRAATLPESFRLWTLLPIREQITQAFIDRYSEAIRSTLSPLSNTKDIQALIYLIAQSQSIDLLWSHWDLVANTLHKDSSFGTAFFDRSLRTESAESRGLIQKWATHGDPFALRITEIKKALESLDSSTIVTQAPSSIAGHPIESDLERFRVSIEQMKHFKTIAFFDSPNFESEIQKEIRRLSDFRKHFSQGKWNSPQVRSAAHRCFNLSVDSLSRALEGITFSDPQTQAQLKQLSGMIRQWSNPA